VLVKCRHAGGLAIRKLLRKVARVVYLAAMTIATVGTVPEWTITDRLRKARELTEQLMRHESLTSTQMYTAVDESERRDAIRRLAA
jgi:hypothetical protein